MIRRHILPGVLSIVTNAARGRDMDTNKTQQFQGDPQKRIGRYQIIKKIGEGGMGQVFQAYDTSLERSVALKLLLPNNSDKTAIQRFIREARSTAKLRHPHIVTIYDFEQYKHYYFIVMDLVVGWPLDKLIANQKLTCKWACLIAVAVLDALAYAHQNQIIHRDIKPSNILLDKQGTPFVTDFGLAKFIGDKTAKISQSGTILGTPCYMSPEQAQAESPESVDARTDIYSLGAVFYEMLVGRPPFTGDSAFTILYKLASEAIAPPTQINPQIPRILESISLKALCKEKSQRYARAEDMAGDLRAYLQQQSSDEQLRYSYANNNNAQTSIAPTQQLPAKIKRGRRTRRDQKKTLFQKATAKTQSSLNNKRRLIIAIALVAIVAIISISAWVGKYRIESKASQRWQQICQLADPTKKLAELKKISHQSRIFQ